jgi:hypothetical protein
VRKAGKPQVLANIKQKELLKRKWLDSIQNKIDMVNLLRYILLVHHKNLNFKTSPEENDNESPLDV